MLLLRPQAVFVSAGLFRACFGTVEEADRKSLLEDLDLSLEPKCYKVEIIYYLYFSICYSSA